MKKKLASVLMLSLLATPAFAQDTLTYPDTNKIDKTHTYHGEEVPDPYFWLEDDRSKETEAWVKAENAVTDGYLEKIAFRPALKQRIKELMNYERVSAPSKHGDYQYFFKNDGLQNHSVLYRVPVSKPDAVPEDFLTLLLRAEGPDGLSPQEIEDNIITFIGAGHETTARALGWALFCLANAPAERETVEAEIDGLLGSKAVPPPQNWLALLPKTRAVFEEAMRLYPPAPSINRAAIEEDRYGDVVIPKGITVLVMPWTLHRHRALWEEPDAFIPSRFWPENRETIDRFQYLPFGAGPRICIGANFALQEAVIALGVLLHRFRFDMAEGANDPWPVQKLTTQPEGGIHMTVTRR